MNTLIDLQEIMLKNNLVIRALPKKYQTDSFIVSIKNNKFSSIAGWEWLTDERKKLIVFSSLEEIIKYFQN